LLGISPIIWRRLLVSGGAPALAIARNFKIDLGGAIARDLVLDRNITLALDRYRAFAIVLDSARDLDFGFDFQAIGKAIERELPEIYLDLIMIKIQTARRKPTLFDPGNTGRNVVAGRDCSIGVSLWRGGLTLPKHCQAAAPEGHL
jgi:hypothetical protein